MDYFHHITYSKEAMITKFTTCFLLAAIVFQGVFGGLNESVSICLGGGHEHEVAEVVEHCAFECSHHDDWVTSSTYEEHIGNCDCTDVELGLIVLLTTLRAHDSVNVFTPSIFTFKPIATQVNSQTWQGPPRDDDDLGMMHRIAVIRSTRLRV